MGDSIPVDAVEIASRRGELLNRFLQEKERFHKLQRTSNAAIAEMATTLEELGRLWEAEAWTAVGLAEPDADVAALKRVRERIVGRLNKNTPWQLEESHPYVSFDLSFLPLPQQKLLAGSDRVALDHSGVDNRVHNGGGRTIVPSVMPKLVEQSTQRGLVDAPSKPVTVGEGIVPLYSQLGFGGATLDFDSDGWPDIYLASCGKEPMSDEAGRGHLYRNLGGRFVDVGNVVGIDDRGFAQGVAAGDINEDGFTDLVLLNYGFDQVFINNGDGTYAERVGWFSQLEQSWSTSGAIADIDLDGISDFVCLKYCTAGDPLRKRCTVPPSGAIDYCAPTNFAAEVDRFYRGQSDGLWVDANELWNAVPVNPGRGLGVVVGQLDREPGVDVFITNDMTSNHYWCVDQPTPFALQETAVIRGLALDERSRPQASMGVAVGDFDIDGDTDFLITNFEYEHNTLYDQQRSGFWKDKSRASGIVDSSVLPLGFGAQAVDLDNDSQLEVVVANGHVHHNAESGYAQLPQILRRSERGEYEPWEPAKLAGYFGARHVGRALWSLDFDRDHLVDLVVTHQSESTALIHNQTSGVAANAWLRIRLVGTNAARDAVGSVVSVSCGDKELTKAVVAGDGFFCSSEDTLHFGLGNAGSADATINVSWPDGSSQSYRASVNQECLIIEGESEVFVHAASLDTAS